MLAILNNGRALFSDGSNGGLSAWSLATGAVQLSGISDVGAMRAVNGSKRRVAFTSKANGDTTTSLYVAPY